jgi:dihydropteroate synthase
MNYTSGIFKCGRFEFDLRRPLVMGIVNTTPDSFSDGGSFANLISAIRHVDQLIAEGADVIDIGGESTRPSAPEVSLDEELDRVIPLVEKIRGCDAAISIDTYKPEVMSEALAAGADMINDIWAFRQPRAIDAVRDSNCGLCVMHMHGRPSIMQAAPFVEHIVDEVRDFLATRVDDLLDAGLQANRICLDPGFGFGKSVEQNYVLLKHLQTTSLGFPILVGMSRKSMLKNKTDTAPRDRVASSIAAAVLAVERGAAIVRVHDVAATRGALTVWEAMQAA